MSDHEQAVPSVQPCPLCLSRRTAHYWQDKKRRYRHCYACRFVFVPRAYHLGDAAEYREYQLHQNNADDVGYLRFLERAIVPLQAFLRPGLHGLDFGSGPSPVLASELARRFQVRLSLFDKYYAPDPSVFEQRYDFIVSTEVVEHLDQPGANLSQLWRCLKPEGVMVLMTKRLLSRRAFAHWHYKNDPTHIGFFSSDSFRFVASSLGAKVWFPEPDVAVLQRFSPYSARGDVARSGR